MSPSQEDSFVIEGKLALPYQYFAGRTGSRFLIALRDEEDQGTAVREMRQDVRSPAIHL